MTRVREMRPVGTELMAFLPRLIAGMRAGRARGGGEEPV